MKSTCTETRPIHLFNAIFCSTEPVVRDGYDSHGPDYIHKFMDHRIIMPFSNSKQQGITVYYRNKPPNLTFAKSTTAPLDHEAGS